MSIYRAVDRYPRSDVYAPAAEERLLALAPMSGASQISMEHDQYQHLRKATPANKAFPRTLMWVATLPSDIQPRALLRRHPRIANLIATLWADRQWFRTYAESLLADTRGNRRGFPPDVLNDLLTLQRYHDATEKNSPTWRAIGKRG